MVGLAVLLGVGALGVAFEASLASSPVALVLVVASVLLVLGGFDATPDLVAWYRFVGLGELLFGAIFALIWIAPAVGEDRTTSDLALAAVGVANALIFGFIGVDWFLGGRHYDLSRFEPGPILGGRSDGESCPRGPVPPGDGRRVGSIVVGQPLARRTELELG